MTVQLYVPNDPYIIKSGKHVGKALEIMMFREYYLLIYLYNKIHQNPVKNRNEFDKHLEWLLTRGENRKPIMICPFCQKEKVEFFSVLSFVQDNVSIGREFVSCHYCLPELKANAPSRMKLDIYHFRFSSLMEIRPGLRETIKLYKKVFGLSDQKLTKERAFAFFKSD